MNWSASTDASWLSIFPTSGSESQLTNVILNSGTMNVGSYGGQVTIVSPEAVNSPFEVPVTLDVMPRDTLNLAGTNTLQGGKFSLDLGLHNFVPTDSVSLALTFDDSQFVFDSVQSGNRVVGMMTWHVMTTQTAGMQQVILYTRRQSGELPAGNGVIAALYFRCLPAVPDGEYPVYCKATILDSLEILLPVDSVQGIVSVSSVTAVGPEPVGTQPTAFRLHQNSPNPFNTGTEIAFDLGSPSEIALEIFNILGKRVRFLESGRKSSGTYTANWDGKG